jgi:hypothetical protein
MREILALRAKLLFDYARARLKSSQSASMPVRPVGRSTKPNDDRVRSLRWTTPSNERFKRASAGGTCASPDHNSDGETHCYGSMITLNVGRGLRTEKKAGQRKNPEHLAPALTINSRCDRRWLRLQRPAIEQSLGF